MANVGPHRKSGLGTAPYKLPRSNTKIIEALQQNAGLMAPAARALGVSRNSLMIRIAKEPELRKVRDEAVEIMLDIAEGHLMNGIRSGDKKDVRYFLRTRGRNRGYGDRTEVVGDGGGPVHVIIEGTDALL
jgi:hypothetical protein